MGEFVPQAPGPCVLQPVDAATAQCATPVTYTPTNRGAPDGTGPGLNTHMINVAYANDSWHSSSTRDLQRLGAQLSVVRRLNTSRARSR